MKKIFALSTLAAIVLSPVLAASASAQSSPYGYGSSSRDNSVPSYEERQGETRGHPDGA